MSDRREVIIDYTNHRGERAERRVLPVGITYNADQWHTTYQWLLIAHDVDKGALRNFAMNDIHSWVPSPSS